MSALNYNKSKLNYRFFDQVNGQSWEVIYLQVSTMDIYTLEKEIAHMTLWMCGLGIMKPIILLFRENVVTKIHYED